MDYYQGIVADYITRENRARFINSEFLLELTKNEPNKKGQHWWVDILTIDFEKKAVILCEVTYAESLQALSDRLAEWELNWTAVKKAIRRDTGVPEAWVAIPWLFTPDPSLLDDPTYAARLKKIRESSLNPLWTPLEAVAPWRYRENQKAALWIKDK
jgi:hypothetical protein